MEFSLGGSSFTSQVTPPTKKAQPAETTPSKKAAPKPKGKAVVKTADDDSEDPDVKLLRACEDPDATKRRLRKKTRDPEAPAACKTEDVEEPKKKMKKTTDMAEEGADQKTKKGNKKPMEAAEEENEKKPKKGKKAAEVEEPAPKKKPGKKESPPEAEVEEPAPKKKAPKETPPEAEVEEPAAPKKKSGKKAPKETPPEAEVEEPAPPKKKSGKKAPKETPPEAEVEEPPPKKKRGKNTPKETPPEANAAEVEEPAKKKPEVEKKTAEPADLPPAPKAKKKDLETDAVAPQKKRLRKAKQEVEEQAGEELASVAEPEAPEAGEQKAAGSPEETAGSEASFLTVLRGQTQMLAQIAATAVDTYAQSQAASQTESQLFASFPGLWFFLLYIYMLYIYIVCLFFVCFFVCLWLLVRFFVLHDPFLPRLGGSASEVATEQFANVLARVLEQALPQFKSYNEDKTSQPEGQGKEPPNGLEPDVKATQPDAQSAADATQPEVDAAQPVPDVQPTSVPDAQPPNDASQTGVPDGQPAAGQPQPDGPAPDVPDVPDAQPPNSASQTGVPDGQPLPGQPQPDGPAPVPNAQAAPLSVQAGENEAGSAVANSTAPNVEPHQDDVFEAETQPGDVHERPEPETGDVRRDAPALTRADVKYMSEGAAVGPFVKSVHLFFCFGFKVLFSANPADMILANARNGLIPWEWVNTSNCRKAAMRLRRYCEEHGSAADLPHVMELFEGDNKSRLDLLRQWLQTGENCKNLEVTLQLSKEVEQGYQEMEMLLTIAGMRKEGVSENLGYFQ